MRRSGLAIVCLSVGCCKSKSTPSAALEASSQAYKIQTKFTVYKLHKLCEDTDCPANMIELIGECSFSGNKRAREKRDIQQTTLSHFHPQNDHIKMMVLFNLFSFRCVQNKNFSILCWRICLARICYMYSCWLLFIRCCWFFIFFLLLRENAHNQPSLLWQMKCSNIIAGHKKQRMKYLPQTRLYLRVKQRVRQWWILICMGILNEPRERERARENAGERIKGDVCIYMQYRITPMNTNGWAEEVIRFAWQPHRPFHLAWFHRDRIQSVQTVHGMRVFSFDLHFTSDFSASSHSILC